MTPEQHYESAQQRSADIKEHMPLLRAYANECESVYELGVGRIISTWAFLTSNARKITSVDIKHPSELGGDLNACYEAARALNKEFEFLLKDCALMDPEEVDLTFIDTYHVYEQCLKELNLYGPKTRKYIILHDTVLFGERGEGHAERGLNDAIHEFVEQNEEWVVHQVCTKENGLTVLKRK